MSEEAAAGADCLITINVPFRFLLGLLLPGEATQNELALLHRDMRSVHEKLNQLQEGIYKLMATDADLKNVLTRIDEATSQQGTILITEGDTLKKISDEIDAFIAAAKNGTPITDQQFALLQANADHAEAIAAALQTQADFSIAIASKGAGDPVPLPVPPATPPPVNQTTVAG